MSLFYLSSSSFAFYIKNRILPPPQTITLWARRFQASQIQLERAFHLLPHHHKKLSQACLELSIDDKLRQWWILKASLKALWIHCLLKASILIPSWPPYIKTKGSIELTHSRSIQNICGKINMYKYVFIYIAVCGFVAWVRVNEGYRGNKPTTDKASYSKISSYFEECFRPLCSMCQRHQFNSRQAFQPLETYSNL